MNKLGITKIILLVAFSFVWFMIGYTYLCNKKSPEKLKYSEDYLSAHHCEAEEILIVDGEVRVRYLCDGDENNDDAA